MKYSLNGLHLTESQKQFLDDASQAAFEAHHPFPSMAGCEAALESAYGTSQLAREDNNLFGTKQHQHPIYGTAYLPTHEFLDGQWVIVEAAWVKYPDWATSMKDRVATLQRMAPHYPHYANALAATDKNVYIAEVSKTWSTDPDRASKVLAIHKQYMGD